VRLPSSSDLLYTTGCLLSASRLRTRLVKNGIPERVAVVELIRANFMYPTVYNLFDVSESHICFHGYGVFVQNRWYSASFGHHHQMVPIR